jgi:D-serine deaminase-like pyridoxal phosphate-dependent protein
MSILDYFQFEPAGKRIEDLETPVPIIDVDVVERNLKRWQARCDKAGFANRPHIKTHKLAPLAKYQLELGARGITVQKLGEAEVMANAGISNMLLTFNILGRHKLERLAALTKRTDISVVADNADILEGLGGAGQAAGREISVLVECDTGGKRNGAQTPQEAIELAKAIDATEGICYGGLMTYTRPGTRPQADAFFVETCDLAAKSGLATKVVSSGGSPEMWKDDGLEHITEYRAGTYIYFDRSLAERGTCTYDDCALTVLSTIVSRPTRERALIDAGSKALTSDLLNLQGYGVVQEMDRARVYDVNEEHGYLDISDLAVKPKVGDLVRVTPNHVCPVSNLFDKVVFVKDNEVLGAVKVDARGTVQ